LLTEKSIPKGEGYGSMRNNNKTAGVMFLILAIVQFAVAAWYSTKLSGNELEFGLHIIIGVLAMLASLLFFREGLRTESTST
jgi:uncharacterized membrane protein